MDQLNSFLQTLISSNAEELRLEPNATPYVVTAGEKTDVSSEPILGTQIAMLIFPLIPQDVKRALPEKPQIDFVLPHSLGNFDFTVRKSPAGLKVAIRAAEAAPAEVQADRPESPETNEKPAGELAAGTAKLEVHGKTNASDADGKTSSGASEMYDLEPKGFIAPAEEYIPEADADVASLADQTLLAERLVERRSVERRVANALMADRMDDLLRRLAGIGASDLHLAPGCRPLVRLNHRLDELECDEDVLDAETVSELIFAVMPPAVKKRFTDHLEVSYTYEIRDVGRYRCSVFNELNGVSVVVRFVPPAAITAEQLELPNTVLATSSIASGLVIFSGPSSSGKSTTMAAMVDRFNASKKGRIITIEDPIEFLHRNKKCAISQREVHTHAVSGLTALRSAVREDADLIVIGELTTPDTTSVALRAAASGRLIYCTINAGSTVEAIEELINTAGGRGIEGARRVAASAIASVVHHSKGAAKNVTPFSVFLNSRQSEDAISSGDIAGAVSGV